MGAVQGPPAERTIQLLDYDPELGSSLPAERHAEARASARATLVTIARGEHAARELAGGRDVAYGVLLVDGLLNRTVALDDVTSAQLLGRGDLVPVGGERSGALVPSNVRWTVIEPVTAAVLDDTFLLTVRRWPELVAALFERVAAQEERRDVHRALSQLPRVEDRVHALLWLLAERWGQVTGDGVVLGLRMTHELLGQLVGAKRPTVSLALKQLEADDDIRRRPAGGWLLVRRWPPNAGGTTSV